MKITFILPFAGLAGGIRVVAMYAERLQRRGHKVTVISVPRPKLSFKQKVKNTFEGKGWPKKISEPSHFDGLDVDHFVIDKDRPVVNDDVPDADVVIATWWKTAEWASNFHQSKGKKFYFVQGHELFEWSPIERVKATYMLPFKKIVVSRWLADIMREKYADDKVALIPNSVDIQFFNSKQRNRQESPTIGFIYSTAEIKGVDIIIDALNMVLQTERNMRVLSFSAELESSKLPLPQNAEYHYKPSQETIREIYSSCDFWLFGSRAEGFGLPILEAMACGTPVIANAAGAAPELTASGGGVLLKEKNAQVMAKAILDCFEAPLEAWCKMSDNARKTAEAYTWDDAVILFERALLDD